MKSALLCLLLAIALMMCGCGGGGGTTSNAGGQDSAYGPFQTRAVSGTPRVLTTSNGGPTVTAVVGSAFSKITYSPTPSLANTRIAFFKAAALTELFVAPSNDASLAQAVPGMTSVSSRPSWSRDGRIVVGRNITGTSAEIWVVNADGSNPHKIGFGLNPAWAPDNFHIAFAAFAQTGGEIWTMTSSGGSVTQLTNMGGNGTPFWSPDSSQIFFIHYNSATARHELWKMNANGSSQAMVLNAGDIDYAAINPQGNELVYDFNNDVDTFLYAVPYPIPTGQSGGLLAGASNNAFYDSPVWAPDGSKVLFREYVGGGVNLVMTTAGGNNRSVYASVSDTSLGSAGWEPFPLPQPFVSSSGGYVFGTTSSGFLYGLNGDGFSSFLTFTATTPTSATVSVDPVTPGQSNLIYRINADAITSIKFMNGFGSAVQTVTVPSGTKQALVGFNASTGGIVSILVGLKMNPLKSKQGVVYNGAFTGVFDAHGKNFAANGASQVVLSRSAEVASVR